MEKRLQWNAIGLESKTKTLLERINTDKNQIPKEETKTFRKLQGYTDELKNILDSIERIKTDLLPKLEKILRIQFKTPELIYLALCRPSIRNIYMDLEKYFGNTEKKPFDLEEFNQLAASGDAAEILAFGGDSALNLAVIQYIWDSSISTTGKLTEKRQKIVKNENLAILCDKWHLYEYRIKKFQEIPQDTKDDTINHEKGTLIEALYGVIYLEFGFHEVSRIIPLLQSS